jgi:hypothetical protein
MSSRWFQIHLSTAFMLMLLAGIIVGVNVIPRSERIAMLGSWSEEVVSLEKARSLVEHGILNFGRDRVYGWPYEFYNYSDTVTVEGEKWKPLAGTGDFYWLHADNRASKRYLAYDILFWLAIPVALHAFINRIELRRPLHVHLVSVVLMLMALLMVYVWNVEETYVEGVTWSDSFRYAKGWPWPASYSATQSGPFFIVSDKLLFNVGILLVVVCLSEMLVRSRRDPSGK